MGSAVLLAVLLSGLAWVFRSRPPQSTAVKEPAAPPVQQPVAAKEPVPLPPPQPVVEMKPVAPRLEPTPPAGFTALFDGKSLGGWEEFGQENNWEVRAGILRCKGSGHGILRTKRTYGDFELEMEWRLPRKAESGVLLHLAEHEVRRPKRPEDGVEVRLADEPPPGAWFRHTNGGLVGLVEASGPPRYNGPDRWNRFRIRWQGQRVVVEYNGGTVVDTKGHPKMKNVSRQGAIALRSVVRGEAEFRNLFIRELR